MISNMYKNFIKYYLKTIRKNFSAKLNKLYFLTFHVDALFIEISHSKLCCHLTKSQ